MWGGPRNRRFAICGRTIWSCQESSPLARASASQTSAGEMHKEDIAWIFAEHANPAFLRELVTDKGFNPPPFWAVAAGAVANTIPPKGPRFTLVMLADLLIFVAAIVVVWWNAGEQVARLTFVLTLFYFGTFSSLGGQFLQYFWVLGLVGSVALWRQERPALSGALLGVSAGIRSFPIFFALPLFVAALHSLAQGHIDRRAVRFCIACTGALGICFVIGSMSVWGLGAWADWRDKIAMHQHYLRGEIFNIGLPTLITTALSGETRTATTYKEDFPHALTRIASFDRLAVPYYLICGIVVALWLFLLFKTRHATLFGYGYIPLYLGLALSPFYHLSLVLLPFMFSDAPRLTRTCVFWGTSFLVAVHAPLLRSRGYITFYFIDHMVSASLIFMLVMGMLFFSLKDIRENQSGQRLSQGTLVT